MGEGLVPPLPPPQRAPWNLWTFAGSVRNGFCVTSVTYTFYWIMATAALRTGLDRMWGQCLSYCRRDGGPESTSVQTGFLSLFTEKSRCSGRLSLGASIQPETPPNSSRSKPTSPGPGSSRHGLNIGCRVVGWLPDGHHSFVSSLPAPTSRVPHGEAGSILPSLEGGPLSSTEMQRDTT